MALIKPLPEGVKSLASAYSACVGGAILIEETLEILKQVGLSDI